ncbi:MAG: hypothetical protein F6K03_05815 [Kamptonema sp. SIO4C4]|nr:hypothetical protein [Kamptonema sp. SIO4C4]
MGVGYEIKKPGFFLPLGETQEFMQKPGFWFYFIFQAMKGFPVTRHNLKITLAAIAGILISLPYLSLYFHRIGATCLSDYRFACAGTYLTLSLVLNPKNAASLHDLGVFRLWMYDHQQAYTLLRKAERQGKVTACQNAARLDIRLFRFSAEKRLKVCLAQVKDEEQQYTVLTLLAWLSILQGQEAEARQWLDQAQTLTPEQPLTACLQGQLLEKQGKQQPALTQYKQCQTADPYIIRLTQQE